MRKELILAFILLVMLPAVSADFVSNLDIEMKGNSIKNATDINATRLYQNGNLVLDTTYSGGGSSTATNNTGSDTILVNETQGLSANITYFDNRYLEEVKNDTTPELGGNLDANGYFGHNMLYLNVTDNFYSGDNGTVINRFYLGLWGNYLVAESYHGEGDVNVTGAIIAHTDADNPSNLAFGAWGYNSNNIRLPRFVVQNGGTDRSSFVVRSLSIIGDDRAWLNGSNNSGDITNMSKYLSFVGEEQNIDFATDVTGADLYVGDDLQVGGDVYVKDTDGEYHFLTRSLEIQDENLDYTVASRLNVSIVANNLSLEDSDGDGIKMVIDQQDTILSESATSIVLSEGTNSTPNTIYVYYDGNPPTLTTSTSDPGLVADIAQVKLGNNHSYGSAAGSAQQSEFTRNSYYRAFDEGSLYVSGFTPNVTSDNINISGGVMTVILRRRTITANQTIGEAFTILFNGTFEQLNSIDDLSAYANTGNTVTNNRYFNVVCGIVNDDLVGDNMKDGEMWCGMPNEPASEYTSLVSAESDAYNSLNVFPNDLLLKRLYIPVVRVIMQRTGGVNTIQTLSNGERYFDLRGSIVGIAGSPPTPSVTDHGQLDGLLDDDHPQYMLDSLFVTENATIVREGTATCGTGDFLQNVTANSSGIFGDCLTPSGSGDITAVNTNGPYLSGGVSSGDADLLLNESYLNATIDARSTGGDVTDTRWGINGPFLYNNSGNLDFNETRVNETINELDTDTTYTASGTLLDLTGTTFSVNEGTLNNNDLCRYVTGQGLVCDQTDSDTTYDNGTGINLTGTTFSIMQFFRLPGNSCADGEIAEWNATSQLWECGTDNTAASGMSQWNLAASDTGGTEAITDSETATWADDNKYLNATRSTNTITYSLHEQALNDTIDARDSDTTYTVGQGLSLVGTELNHSDTSSQASSDNSGRTYIQDIILDTFGHITSIVTATETVVDTDTRWSILGPYLVNSSGSLSLDESELNSTIDARDSDTTYTASGTLLDLTGTVFSVNEGTLTNGNLCRYVSGTGLVCDQTDSDTTYTNGSGLSLVGTEFNHSDTSSQASSDNSGRTYIQDILLDDFGHVTSLTTATETVVDTDTDTRWSLGYLMLNSTGDLAFDNSTFQSGYDSYWLKNIVEDITPDLGGNLNASEYNITDVDGTRYKNSATLLNTYHNGTALVLRG